jgi:phage FluMu protein Com
MQIEREHAAQVEHARALYHMAVQAAERELDMAIQEAGKTRDVRLTVARQEAHRAAEDASSPEVTVHCEFCDAELEAAPEALEVTCPDCQAVTLTPNGVSVAERAHLAAQSA